MSKKKVLKALSNGLRAAIAKIDTETTDYFAQVQGNKIWISDAGQFSRDFEKIMMEFFNKQKKEYIAKIKGLSEDNISDESIESDLENELFSNEDDYTKQLINNITPASEQYIKELVKKNIENLVVLFHTKNKTQKPEDTNYFDEKFFNDNSVKYIKNHVIKFSKEVQQTTHDSVINSLVEGYKAGESMTELANRIDSLPEFDRNRAIKVARTETMAASNAGEYESYNQCDYVIGSTWLSSHDSRVRATHAAANGQKRKLGDPFDVGGYKLMFPGDSSLGAPAKEVIHCRCTSLPIFQGESLEE